MIDWNKKRVLVAGGAGQIGSHLTKRLVSLGADVRVCDNLSTGIGDNILGVNCQFWRYDLTNYNKCLQACYGIDYIFQLAANMGGMIYIDNSAKNNVKIAHDNVMINANMLKAAHKTQVKRYFYSSSACVYPTFLQKDVNSPSVNLKESDAVPADPNEFYGWEKLFTEKLCEAYQNDYNMDIRIARFHNVFGECYTSFDKTRGKAPCLMIASVLKYGGGDFTGIWGDGRQTRSFLYAEDCVDGILALMNSDYNKPINIGSDECVTIQQLADMVLQISGKKVDKFVYQMDKPQGVRGRNADLTLVRQVLGWQPKHDLESGLKLVYDWAKERQEKLVNI